MENENNSWYINWKGKDVEVGIKPFNLLEGFEKPELQEIIISKIEKICNYLMSAEQKTALKLSFLELYRERDKPLNFLDLVEYWQNSTLLAELAELIKKHFLFR